MASVSFVLISFALASYAIASPVPASGEKEDATTPSDSGELEVIEIIRTIPVPVAVPVLVEEVDSTTVADTKDGHKIARRAATREESHSNDLIEQSDGFQQDGSLTNLVGRIRVLPSWVG
ncbi:hypothetical protein EVAR_18448_1 [Eumeta japonica]|uniref:Uncharacterized protein n=1 Tax=Eumeta variegata TaxID=151549 RepID=A0A4C1V096_EUMVA|nr:hypothetical protein EVAR_18448_1 [Eumeta japonica]